MSKRTVLILGKSGQLGKEIEELFSKRSFWEVISPEESDANISVFPKINKIIADLQPNVIVNCAAMTNVDGCEKEVVKAFLTNSIGPDNISRSILKNSQKTFLIHISTDYVYDGTIDEKLTSATHSVFERPVNIYGLSKFEGEENIHKNLVEALPYNYLILRTSGLYGKYGRNHFLKKMEEFVSDLSTNCTLIADQKYCPTSARQLANQILVYAEMSVDERRNIIEQFGNVLNACSTTYVSPYIFLTNYFLYRNKYDLISNISPIHFEDYFKKYSTAAKRPKYAWLKNEIAEEFPEINKMTSVDEALKEYVNLTQS